VRALLKTEREVLARLLSVEFQGAESLRIQAASILGAVPNCTCGCPSITPHVDHDAAPPARGGSLLPVELAEMARADGVPRTVLCFLDPDGYLANLECVYYDDVRPEWPRADQCAVLLRDDQRYLEAVALPSGALVRPRERGDRWVSFEPQSEGGFCAATWSGYRECFAGDGSEVARTFTK
jgi:hypothetical protein